MGDRVSLVCFSGVDVAPIIIPKIYSELQNDKKSKALEEMDAFHESLNTRGKCFQLTFCAVFSLCKVFPNSKNVGLDSGSVCQHCHMMAYLKKCQEFVRYTGS